MFQLEELRDLRGTLGLPGTVAPFRAWRGSRDLVARSPKFHVSAVALFASAMQSLAHRPVSSNFIVAQTLLSVLLGSLAVVGPPSARPPQEGGVTRDP